jgi:hypothetical protein
MPLQRVSVGMHLPPQHVPLPASHGVPSSTGPGVQTPFSQVTCSHVLAGLQVLVSLPQHSWQTPEPQHARVSGQVFWQLPPQRSLVGVHFSPQQASSAWQMLSQIPPHSPRVGTHLSPQHVSCEVQTLPHMPPQSALVEPQVPSQQRVLQFGPGVPETVV